VNPIRQPTAFAAPDPTTSSGPTFYYKDRSNTPTHAAVSADGTSVFCVEGYVNTPELSAGRGGGLSQGLPANGPYRSLFRAGSRSESRASASNLNQKANANATTTAAPALHVLAEAAQSPEALSPVSATASSPAPAHVAAAPAAAAAAPSSVPAASKKRSSRKPSPLIASSSPASSVAQLDSTSVALWPSPVASVSASSSSSQSHVIIEPGPPPPRLPRARPSGGGGATNKGKHREKGASGLPETHVNGNSEGEQRYERIPLPSGCQPSKSPFSPIAEPREMEYAAQDFPRNLQNKNKNKNRAASSYEMDSLLQAPQPAAVDDGGYGYDHAEGDYCPSYYEAEPSGASEIVREGGQSLSPPQAVVNHHPASAHITSKESSPAAMADSRSVTPSTKPRMVTLLIEDRRHGTDELAEVHVPLKTTSEGCLWADARDVCAALQSGPSRIDGGLFCMHALIELTDSSLLLLRARQSVHNARKVSTDISACICGWRRDDAVSKLEGGDE
jgi:hypothetical protein